MASIIGKYINKIADAKNKLEDANKQINCTNVIFAYRGESRDYGKTKLMPSIFREDSYIAKEKYLYELLSDYKVIANKVDRYIEKAIEAQHYVSISRILDITFSLLPAIYFACEAHEDEDGICYVFGFPNHYSPHSTYIENVYSDLLSQNPIVYDKNFRVLSHSRYNERITAQTGGFILFPGDKHCAISRAYYEEVIIEAKDKKQLLIDLRDLFNINRDKIYPSKENNGKAAREWFEQANSYKNNEISLDNEIEMYFDRIDYEIELMIVRNKQEIDEEIEKYKNQVANSNKKISERQQKKAIQEIKLKMQWEDDYIERFLRKEKDDMQAFIEAYFEKHDKADKNTYIQLISQKFVEIGSIKKCEKMNLI